MNLNLITKKIRIIWTKTKTYKYIGKKNPKNYQNVWNAAKAVLKVKFITLTACIWKRKVSNQSSNCLLKKLQKNIPN